MEKLVLIVYLRILTCKMFSSTIDYIRRRVQRFPQDINRLTSFNPLDCFAIHFRTILIQFLCISGFRFPVYPILVRILHWQKAQSKCLNEGMLILSDWELPALPYVATITAISWLPEYWLYYEHRIVWWPCGKVICHSQKYTRDHWVMQREALWLYAIILYSPIEH